VDNTALGGYWQQQARVIKENRAGEWRSKFKPLCSEHDPHIMKWHGEFPKRLAIGYVQSNDGYLYTLEESQGRFAHLRPFRAVKLPEGVGT
jgi:hypothetical protein